MFKTRSFDSVVVELVEGLENGTVVLPHEAGTTPDQAKSTGGVIRLPHHAGRDDRHREDLAALIAELERTVSSQADPAEEQALGMAASLADLLVAMPRVSRGKAVQAVTRCMADRLAVVDRAAAAYLENAFKKI